MQKKKKKNMNNLKNMKCKSVTAGKKLRMTAFNDRVDSHYKLVNISWDYSQYLAMISWQSSKKVQRSMIELSLEVPKHVTPSTVQTLLTTPSLMSLFKCLRISQRWMLNPLEGWNLWLFSNAINANIGSSRLLLQVVQLFIQFGYLCFIWIY